MEKKKRVLQVCVSACLLLTLGTLFSCGQDGVGDLSRSLNVERDNGVVTIVGEERSSTEKKDEKRKSDSTGSSDNEEGTSASAQNFIINDTTDTFGGVAALDASKIYFSQLRLKDGGSEDDLELSLWAQTVENATYNVLVNDNFSKKAAKNLFIAVKSSHNAPLPPVLDSDGRIYLIQRQVNGNFGKAIMKVYKDSGTALSLIVKCDLGKDVSIPPIFNKADNSLYYYTTDGHLNRYPVGETCPSVQRSPGSVIDIHENSYDPILRNDGIYHSNVSIKQKWDSKTKRIDNSHGAVSLYANLGSNFSKWVYDKDPYSSLEGAFRGRYNVSGLFVDEDYVYFVFTKNTDQKKTGLERKYHSKLIVLNKSNGEEVVSTDVSLSNDFKLGYSKTQSLFVKKRGSDRYIYFSSQNSGLTAQGAIFIYVLDSSNRLRKERQDPVAISFSSFYKYPIEDSGNLRFGLYKIFNAARSDEEEDVSLWSLGTNSVTSDKGSNYPGKSQFGIKSSDYKMVLKGNSLFFSAPYGLFSRQ